MNNRRIAASVLDLARFTVEQSDPVTDILSPFYLEEK